LGAQRLYQMEKQKQISRKLFLRFTAGLSLGFGIWIWNRISNFQMQRENQVEYRHNQNIPLGINYFGKYYLFRTGDSLRAFSTTCTHAGCRIGKGNKDTLQCSCHGSQFDGETGRPIKGPAIKPLQELGCRFDITSGQWVVRFLPGLDGNA
jgi:Rieske Fe-S protein